MLDLREALSTNIEEYGETVQTFLWSAVTGNLADSKRINGDSGWWINLGIALGLPVDEDGEYAFDWADFMKVWVELWQGIFETVDKYHDLCD